MKDVKRIPNMSALMKAKNVCNELTVTFSPVTLFTSITTWTVLSSKNRGKL